MIEFGKSLRQAREAKGYTVSQIADMTHLKSSAVEGLENEDFSMIAAPIYGRGFVKLYCEAVGLEAKPFVDEFMAIINGNREISIRERPTAAPQPAPAEPQPAPAAPQPAPAAPQPAPAAPQPARFAPAPEPDLFSQDEPVTPVAPPPAIPPLPQHLPQARDPEAVPLSRYAAPVDGRTRASGYSPVNLRIVTLAAVLIALLVAIAFGIRALYRTTASPAPTPAETSEPPEPPAKPEPEPATATVRPASPQKPAATAAEAAKPRTPQDIPSLYID